MSKSGTHGLLPLTSTLGKAESAVSATLDDWRQADKVRRLWNRDATLWTNQDEAKWLGWLDIVAQQQAQVADLRALAADIKNADFRDILLMGMGGSSLCPEVLKETFGVVDGYPELFVLDSTVPAQVKASERKVDPTRTVGIVSSKSGSTTEPNVFRQYFEARIQQAIGKENAGDRFIAVTDPNTKMNKIAEEQHFRHITFGLPTIGGRFSALSNFGMVPAAIMGLDVEDFLARAQRMVDACGPDSLPEQNPGVQLGAILGTLGKDFGRNKVTVVASPGIGDLGAWLEQLMAESTGKRGKGLVPVDAETLGTPQVYSDDRLFVYVRLETAPSAEQDAALEALRQAGHPVVQIDMTDIRDLGAEFFRWEIATAVAGSILGINPFDQPDVEASKIKTRELTERFTATGQMPQEAPIASNGGLRLYTDAINAGALAAAAMDRTPESLLKAHLARISPGDYFAINAYVEMNPQNTRLLNETRLAVRDAHHVATTLGFGPRFLHSTGQLHKGGPNIGVFLQVTSDDAEDIPIPGESFTFGQLKSFQAQGDFEVLIERGRRALRIHLGPDVPAGLALLREMVAIALA